MPHRAVVLVPFVLFAVALLGADPPASIPRDTLPKDLPCDTVPLGLGPRPASPANPVTTARVALGRKLFFDPILSADRTVACASCHHPDHGFASVEARPRGVGGRVGTRRAPTLLNRAYGTAFFWDGRAATLEEQALKPIESPDEMASSVPEAIRRLKADAGYRDLFAASFDGGVTADNLAKAIACFERVLLRGNSPVDRFRQKGERSALTAAELHGLWLYESKGQCWKCHSGTNFTDEAFHNTGVGWGADDLGRFLVTKTDADRGKYKTPTLRGVKLTAPYMHDGSLKTLEEVVEFYNKGGGANPHLDPVMKPLNLSKEELADLIAFLKSL
jgi:cytochrome c peroxidase